MRVTCFLCWRAFTGALAPAQLLARARVHVTNATVHQGGQGLLQLLPLVEAPGSSPGGAAVSMETSMVWVVAPRPAKVPKKPRLPGASGGGDTPPCSSSTAGRRDLPPPSGGRSEQEVGISAASDQLGFTPSALSFSSSSSSSLFTAFLHRLFLRPLLHLPLCSTSPVAGSPPPLPPPSSSLWRKQPLHLDASLHLPAEEKGWRGASPMSYRGDGGRRQLLCAGHSITVSGG